MSRPAGTESAGGAGCLGNIDQIGARPYNRWWKGEWKCREGFGPAERAMTEKTDLKKVLVLNGPALEASGVLSFLRDHFEVRTAGELDEALDVRRMTEGGS